MSILNSHFLMHAHHNFTSFVILYICLSKYKPYRAYVTNLIYSTIKFVCLSVCLSGLISKTLQESLMVVRCWIENSVSRVTVPHHEVSE